MDPVESQLWAEVKGNDPVAAKRARDEIVRRYMPIAGKASCRAARNRPFDRDDARQEAVIGLLQAIRDYDPSYGKSFGQYCVMRVTGSVMDAQRKFLRTRRSGFRPHVSLNAVAYTSEMSGNEVEFNLGDDDKNLEKVDTKDLVGMLMRSMSELQKRILRHKYWEGMMVNDISKSIGCCTVYIWREHSLAMRAMLGILQRVGCVPVDNSSSARSNAS